MSTLSKLSTSKPLRTLRELIWPIYGHEHKKFLAMLFLFFLISFNFNVLRTIKETLVITAHGSSAEVIPFIKVWAMFPSAVFMTFLFTWLSNRFSKESVFYIFMTLFLGYFTLFLFYLFPNSEALHLHKTADWLQAHLPAGCKGLTLMLRHWTFTSFFVMSELWGTTILIMLFWGFINQITKLDEAKRFYGLLGLGANISGIASGQISIYLNKLSLIPFIEFGQNTCWERCLLMIMSLVLGVGLITLILFRWTHKNILQNPLYFCAETARQEKAMKGKLSLTESVRHLLKSPYLFYITMIVLTYNISTNLIDILWKDQIRVLYPDANDYNLFLNQVATWIGIVSTLSAIFISGNTIRFLGWTFAALITPILLLVTSLLFFGLLFGRDLLDQYNILIFGLSPLTLLVLVGAVQYVLYKSAKYTLFDATKEMAFIPLSSEDKLKGKTVIDGVCNRLGKSGGSVIHQGLLITFGSFAYSAPYVAGILFLILGAWTSSARSLGKAFHKLSGTTPKPNSETTEQPAVLRPAT
jgi:AAA family ATP:ADP antiporter